MAAKFDITDFPEAMRTFNEWLQTQDLGERLKSAGILHSMILCDLVNEQGWTIDVKSHIATELSTMLMYVTDGDVNRAKEILDALVANLEKICLAYKLWRMGAL